MATNDNAAIPPPLFNFANYSPVSNVGRNIADLTTQLNHAIDRRAAEIGITGAQWVVLIRIASGVGATAAELCRVIRYDSGSMTRMLDRLEKRGLIRRDRCAEDRRIVRLSLTDLGKELYPQLTPIAVDVLNRLLKGFSAEEAALLMKFLDRMLANDVAGEE